MLNLHWEECIVIGMKNVPIGPVISCQRFQYLQVVAEAFGLGQADAYVPNKRLTKGCVHCNWTFFSQLADYSLPWCMMVLLHRFLLRQRSFEELCHRFLITDLNEMQNPLDSGPVNTHRWGQQPLSNQGRTAMTAHSPRS